MEVKWSKIYPGWFMPREKPQCPMNRRLGRPHGQSGHFGEEKNLLSLPGFESSQSAITTLTQTLN